MDMLAVSTAEYAGDYRIHLVFNNGQAGTADLRQFIFTDHRNIFSTLRDQTYFKTFRVEHSTVIWSDALDVAAEYLFYLAFQDDPNLHEQFQQWGYVN